MYKLLIADDEEIEINAFKVMIGSHFENLQVVSAENGIDAIELARKEKPDLIFMDIEMPGMDGLSAIKVIKQEMPRVRFVIHTAYGNFEYAQDAIKAGADDYLLKPVKMNTLIETVERNIRAIGGEKEKLNAFQNLEAKLLRLKPYLEKDIVFSVINGVVDNDMLVHYASVFNVQIRQAYCLIFRVDTLTDMPAELDARLDMKSQLSKEIIELLKSVCQCIAAEYRNGDVLAIIPFEKKFREYDIRVWSVELSNYVRNRLRQKAVVRAAIGGISPSFEKLHISYMEAYRAMRFGMNKMSVVHYEDIKGCEKPDGSKTPEEEISALGEAVVMRNEQEAMRISREIFERIEFDTGNSLSGMKARMIELLISLKKYVDDNTISNVEISVFKDIEFIAAITDRDVLYNQYTSYVTSMINEIGKFTERRKSVVISEVKQYIEQHFSEEVSLEEVAEKACVTPHYLSRLFKKEMGSNFNNYLTEMRLNRAKHLLINTNKSIKEIAYETGFNSQAYFCRVFKKREDKTPSEFINEIEKSNR